MGGCATKPKDAIFESLPSENPSSPEQQTRALQGDPAVANEKVDTGKDETVENSNKEKPLVDLSDPKPDAPTHGGQIKAEETTAITDLVSEIGGSKLDLSSNQFENSDDLKKDAKVDHVEEEKTADPAKASEIPAAPADPAKNSEIPAAPANTAEKEQKTQKADVEAEKAQKTQKAEVETENEHKPQKSNVEVGSSKSDLVETKDIKAEVPKKEQGEKPPISA